MSTPINPGSFELVITSSGLEPDRQIEIREAFLPFASRANEWAVKVASVTDARIARETRLAMRRERIELEKKHADFKARTLAWTRAVDGSRKAISDAYDAMETQMGDIEKAEERKIAAAKAALRAERDAALRQYGVDTQWVQTGEMSDAQFLAMLEQAKTAHEAKIEAARIAKEKAEADAHAAVEAAAAKAKADAEERERQRAENERLRKEAAEREAAAKIEREKLAAERAAAEAKARIEREAREKLEREAAAARKAEADRIAAEKAAAARAAAAPDAAKLVAFAGALEAVELPAMATEGGRVAIEDVFMRLKSLTLAIRFAAKEMEAAK